MWEVGTKILKPVFCAYLGWVKAILPCNKVHLKRPSSGQNEHLYVQKLRALTMSLNNNLGHQQHAANSVKHYGLAGCFKIINLPET